METNRAKEIIVSVLQTALTGKLDPSSNFSPQDVADAIAVKVDFEKTHNNSKCDKIIGILIDNIFSHNSEMKKELEDLGEDEKLLKNFIKGKLTAYEEILNTLNNL
jgi:uncharacterized protein YPO0396